MTLEQSTGGEGQQPQAQQQRQQAPAGGSTTTNSLRWALVLHGGAGMINSDNPDWVAATRAALERALDVGTKLLAAGASALDAAVATVAALEDDRCLNAGRGSVLTESGRHELEASVMTSDGHCGAACLLERVKNPVKLARVVMEATPHVLLSGARAEQLAVAHGLELAPDNEWFTTPQRRAQWQAWRARGTVASHDDIVQQAVPDASTGAQETVGAVALDVTGRLAAATSTGGRCGKYDGRIGDTPIIGAGTWADARVALSGTGIGEAFQRRAACADVAARVKYAGASLAEAVAAVVHADMAPGDGGFIGVDARSGAIVMDFNTPGMGRACADSGGRREVAIFKNG